MTRRAASFEFRCETLTSAEGVFTASHLERVLEERADAGWEIVSAQLLPVRFVGQSFPDVFVTMRRPEK